MRMRRNAEAEILSVCRTCMHAEDAGHVTLEHDLYCCRALVGPLREYAESPSAAYVLVHGCAPACLEHYERDEAVFDSLWSGEWMWEDALAYPPTMYRNDLPEAAEGC